jgi:hypothetical protein
VVGFHGAAHKAFQCPQLDSVAADSLPRWIIQTFSDLSSETSPIRASLSYISAIDPSFEGTSAFPSSSNNNVQISKTMFAVILRIVLIAVCVGVAENWYPRNRVNAHLFARPYNQRGFQSVDQRPPLIEVLVFSAAIYALRARPALLLLLILLYMDCPPAIARNLLVILLSARLGIYMGLANLATAFIGLVFIGTLGYGAYAFGRTHTWFRISRSITAPYDSRRQRAASDARGYARLNLETREIRLMTLLPGTGQSDIPACKLDVVSLSEDQLQYEALSYTWDKPVDGHPVPLKHIFVNGKEFMVSTGLYVALTYLRYPETKRILWIDALCIDQDNFQERSEQVQLMRSIYGSASRVIVWLGEGNILTDLDIQLIRWNCETRNLTPEDAKKHRIALRHVHNVFDCPWWFRIWIIQEVAMAKQEPLVLLGRESVPWSYLNAFYLNLARVLMDFPDQTPNTFQIASRNNVSRLSGIRQMQISGEERSLEWYIRASIRSKSTDPKDRIYALLGLARERDRQNLIPDYDPLKSHVDLYAEVVRHIIDVDGSLNILSYFRHPVDHDSIGHRTKWRSCTRSRPTWIPAFDFEVVGDWSPQSFFDLQITSYKASGILKAKAWISRDLQTLYARGVHFDFVCKTSKPPSSGDTLEYLRDTRRLFKCTQADKLSVEESDTRCSLDRSQSHWRAPIADMVPPLVVDMMGRLPRFNETMVLQQGSPAPEGFGEIYRAIMDNTLPPVTIAHRLAVPLPPEATMAANYEHIWDHPLTKPYLVSCDLAMSRRSAFTTRCGFAGLGPLDVRPGDAVAILFGADIPFILRQRGNHYTFVGDCFVHGIMQGELIDLLHQCEWKPHGPVVKEFELR